MASADDSSRSAPAATVTAEGETFDSAPRRLKFVDVPPPAPGRSVDVAPGIRWARIPLPIDLNHINVWLVDTHHGCVVVDTGLAAPMGQDAWEAIAAESFASTPLRAVLVTHIHPDHIGLAGWLQQRHGVPVLMSRRTHDMAALMLDAKANVGFGDASAAFFNSHGLSDTSEIQSTFRPERFARMTTGLPHVEHFVADSETLQWGSSEWTALETNGHAEGHLCLSNAAARVLISGDQVLPTISSNISLTFRSNDPNPLGSYLSSLLRLRTLAADTLVLPAHGVPFRGLQHRIDDLYEHHEEQLDKLAAACVEPKSAAEVLPLMFRRELKGMHLVLAMGEALAHLEYLVLAGRAERLVGEGGSIRYVSRSE